MLGTVPHLFYIACCKEPMNDFSNEKWQQIKILALRLQALKNILKVFDEQITNQSFANELNPIKEHLDADFDKTLNSLIELTKNGDD
ncbi:hypothetical protein H6F77_21280 [Microcoleus sp. FACHB-831]|uniref:hypothetical protein n=1 Tax=Microcoleus sp. FACHB-831 TaxID=2692827 RepID=UPI0016863200|nr:hypothetical protein [Microcoleus sp. FACHB-831]MBD1923585.1 hypothetical protein [Microcoleus sp. FACHB-831]